MFPEILSAYHADQTVSMCFCRGLKASLMCNRHLSKEVMFSNRIYIDILPSFFYHIQAYLTSKYKYDGISQIPFGVYNLIGANFLEFNYL